MVAFFIQHSTFKPFGAKGGTRTPTALGHWLLRPARLPIPPLSLESGSQFSVIGSRLSELRTENRELRTDINGAPTRTRTWNQQIKSLLLYQLSYGGAGSFLTVAAEELFRYAAADSSNIRFPRRM